jgi:DNA recombination-dependent growth factor C
MSVDQKREEVVSLLRAIDREATDDSAATFRAVSYSTKSTRLGMLTIERLYEVLTDYGTVSTWGQTADQLRDRLRLDALNTHDYGDPFDGRLLRSAELTALIGQLVQYLEGES